MPPVTPETATARPVRYAEDIVPNTETALGSWEVTEAEIVDFGRQWDPLPFHVDAERAAATPLGGLIASGVHTMAILQRLSVERVWSTFPLVMGRDIHSLRMLRPVHVGTVLTGTLRWGAVELHRPERARVAYRSTLDDAAGVRVFEVSGDTVIARRPR